MGPALLEQTEGLDLDLVKQGLENLELAGEHTPNAPAGKTLDESIRIVDIDPLSMDLPLAITQLSAQIAERSIEVPKEARVVVEQLTRWAGNPKRSTVGEVMDGVSALLLAEGLGSTAADGLKQTTGPIEWTDGRFTVTVAMVFRPVLVELVARWMLAEAQASVFCRLGSDISFDRVHMSVAYAAGHLLSTAPQIRSLIMAYFRMHVPVCIAEQALVAANADATTNVLVAVWRLLRRLPEALGVESWGWEAPLVMLMGPQHEDLIRLLACEVLCMVKTMSDHGRAQLLATQPIDAAMLARTLAWLAHGEQHAAQTAESQMHEQNRANYEAKVWQTEGAHAWISEQQLSSSVASVGGVLLHAHGSAPVTDSELVVTPMVARNIHAMALATSRSEPVLLQGPAGSGKTSLVEWVARRTGNELMTVHVSGNMDAKVLLGNYVTTQRAGDFEWRAGLLTTAVTQGSWVLIENVDLAPADVVQTLQPLIESHTLFVASRGQSIRAHERFRLFATLSTDTRTSGRGGSDGLLGSSIWTRLEIGEIDSELPEIVRGAFPKLADDAEALAKAFRRIRDIVRGAGTSGRGPILSTRDLVKWCTRLNAYYAGDPFVVFQEAVDVFTLREADYERWRTQVHSVGMALGVAQVRVDQFIAQHSPAVSASGRSLRIGRATLPAEKAEEERERRPFADTRHSRCLLERLATCVQLSEPALLMGETGTGKTTVVQHLAALAGRPLAVFNLSQQSDASDLLGGFRPVDISRIALKLRSSFDALFSRTVSVRKNAAFLDRVRVAYGKRDWKRLVLLYRASLKNAQKMLDTARGQLQDEEQKAKRPRMSASEEDPKKSRLDQESIDELDAGWAAFAISLDEFDAMRDVKMVFSFFEGALVRAARTGAWILLDEVNLATAETLACLGGLLQRERTLLLAETGARITCHADFRLFGCMNPATDVGKRDLPPALRSSFTELFVHAPDADPNDLLAIVRAHLPATAPVQLCHRAIEFYGAAKTLAAAHALVDGAGQRPHYSLRTLARSLTYARDNAAAYSLKRSLYDGLSMTFATQLEGATQVVLVRELLKVFEGDDILQLLRRAPAARGDGTVLVQGFWLPQAATSDDAADAGSAYVVTRSVEAKLRALARAVMCGRYPVLIQGPTSAGKTSMVQHLARATGHEFVRINNHEHTDLQEYLGAYTSVDGQLVFEEGLLVRALRHGHWLVLDELNLAPSDVLEALNRLLDDNRELVIPETQEVVRPHPHFMLFATQNPAGLYGGRKALSRAFRNRFVELHFDDIPEAELQQIIEDSCHVPPSHAELLVSVYRNLTQVRAQTRIFEASHGFITLRDLFRWANRHASSREELAEHGYMLLAERVRTDDEKRVVLRAIEAAFFKSRSEGSVRARRRIDVDGLYSEARVREMPEFQALQGKGEYGSGIAWTKAMRRLFVLTALCVRFNEPVLLVGDTGCGKTTVCQMLANARGQQLRVVNCHQNTESSDILGSQRPVRNRAALLEQARSVLDAIVGPEHVVETPAALQQLASQLGIDTAEHAETLARAAELLERAQALFAWHDGPLVQALRGGDMFLMDELNLADDSVLERLNSVLEPARTLVLAENVGAAVLTARDGFGFVATMNPGGDYGKRELSPALRNRFTELWAPVTTDRDDLLMVLRARLGAAAMADECAHVMLDFVAYLHNTARVLQHPLSLRDYLVWAEFVVGLHNVMDVRAGVVHGACMVLLDGIGAQGSAFNVSMRAPAAVKAECVRQLRTMAGLADMSTLGVVPSRDVGGDLASLVTRDESRVGVKPFLVETGALKGAADGFALHAPTTFDNLVKVLRAMQVGKPLLLEGSPGVGKTTLVSTLARVAGHRLVRINLSDQTDLMDLFGTDLPVDDGFAWCDAPFLQALKRGDWVLLDEINLASQSVLEGLNSCLDHRGTVYISELDREFELSPGFRLFAAQNPLGQGGGRKGLPRSFVNRFTQVFMDELQRDDLHIICDGVFGAHDSIAHVLEFNWRMHHATMERREFGSSGAPWEFNLRDVSRFMELALSASMLENGPKPVDAFVAMLYEQRMRTRSDRHHVRALFRSVFGRDLPSRTPTLHITEDSVQVGHSVLQRRRTATPTRLRALGGQLTYAESLMTCIEKRWMAILVGGAGAGKTALVRWLASVTGNRLVEFAMNAGVDTSELLGGFEQVDVQRHRSRLVEQVSELVDRLVELCEFGSDVRVQAAAHACALLQQVRRADRDALSAVIAQIVSIARESQTESMADSLGELITAVEQASQAFGVLEAAGRFEWVDGVLVEALERGHWLLLDRANLCSASVLDRLNGLLEPNGVLYVNEDPKRTTPVVPHPEFRIIMAVDPQHGELSRAMRNRGIEICMLPSDNEECLVGDQMAVTRSLGVGRELSAAVRGAEPTLTTLVQTAVHAAERVQRGFPAWADAATDSPVIMPAVHPGPLSAAVAVAAWQAQLVEFASQFVPEGVDSRVWPQRMLLAALCTVQPDAKSMQSLVFQAIAKPEVSRILLLANDLAHAIVSVRRELALTSHANVDVLQSAPVCAALNNGLHSVLQRHHHTHVAHWHRALQASRVFELERAIVDHTRPLQSTGDLRALVLQRPNIDIPYVQSMFALLDGCSELLFAWETRIVSLSEQPESDVDLVACVRDVRVVHAMGMKLHALLEREEGAASEQAVALETMQGALRRLGQGPANVASLLERVGRLVLDTTQSARMWALVHPATLPDVRMRELESALHDARSKCGDEKQAEVVEAMAMLYAAASRKNKDLVVAAVAQFVEKLAEAQEVEESEVAQETQVTKEVIETQVTKEAIETQVTKEAIETQVTPASVLADSIELSNWRSLLHSAVVVGSLPRATEERTQLLTKLRQITSDTSVALDSPWALLLTRLQWQANEHDGSSSLLSLFTDAAFEWYGRLDSRVFDARVDAPQHRLGRAVGTELAWRSATRLHCSLEDHTRAARECRELLRALTEFVPQPENAKARSAELVAMLLVASRAVGGMETRAAVQLLAALSNAGDCAIERDLADEWHAEIMRSDASHVLAPAADAVRVALVEPNMANVWLAAVETGICVLRVAVPGRAVDPAAKAYAQWTWLGDDIATCHADVAAYETVQRTMTGERSSAAIEPLQSELHELERQRAEIELVYRPPTDSVRFAELWHDAAQLVQSVTGRVRDTARQLADPQMSETEYTRVQGASEALQGTLRQFELRVEQRYFAAFRDQAQVWTLCSRQLRYALSELGELRRRVACPRELECARLVCSLYEQPMARGVPATRESNAHMQHVLGQLKTLVYASSSSPLRVYGELIVTLLLRIVLGVQVRGVLDAADLEAVDIILRDANDIHKRSVDEQRKKQAEAASLFKFKATEDETDEQLLLAIFPGFADVFEDAEDAEEPSFADIPEDAVAVIAACHQYLMLQFGVLNSAPDVHAALIADAQRQALQLAASLYQARPELAAMLTADADRGLRGANVTALATVLRVATADIVESPDAQASGVRAEHVHDFYHDAWASEAVLLKPLAAAVAARAQHLLIEWPDHAVLQQISDMSTRLLQLPITTSVAKLLAGLEQLHERAQDWEAYASRDVSITELHDAARLIIRWRQRELNAWPHLLRAQELEFARRPNTWWFSLFSSLVVPESAELSELVSAVDQFMQGSPAGEFRARLNMLHAFAAHRAAILAARSCQEHESFSRAKQTDSIYGPLANAISYYVQYAPCIASQLDATMQGIRKDLTQYVKISTWKDVNPAALRASAQKTHKHLAKCVRRWREALSQPIFQIIQAYQTNAIASARVPQVQLVQLPLSGAGLDIAPPRSLASTGALVGASRAPWDANGLTIDDEMTQLLAQQATDDALSKVLANSPSALAQLARLMSASTVFGSSDSTAPTALEEFSVQIVSDVNYFQHVETPKHLVKKSGEAPAPLSSKKRIIKARGKQDVDDEPAYVEEDEERQKQLLRFWGEQRNLRRTRLKDIIKGLQEIGLRRHFRPIADDTADSADTADKDGKPAKSSALTGLTSVLRGAPLDISSWRESVLAASAIAPNAVHASMAQAQQSWQLSDMGFFRLSAQLAQLRTCAYEEHSTEVSAQQVQHIVGLMENLNSFVARDRTNAAGLLAATTSWMHVAASWGTVSDTRTTVSARELKPRVDALIVQIELFARATRAVGDVDGWRNAAGVALVQGEIATAAVQVVKAQTMLATVGAGATAALLAGGSEDGAARVLATLDMAVQAETQTRLAVEAVRSAIGSSARLAEVRVAVEPWIEPVLLAAAHVDAVLGDPVAAVTVSDDKSDVADVAGAWITAVMNVWQAIRKAEQQFSVSVEQADLNAWGLAPKELLRRLELMEQLVSALHVPTMLPLGQQLAHVCAQTPGAASSAVVRPWVIQYSLVVQHVCALYSAAHQKLVQFALTTATVLTSVVVHGLGSNDIYDSEETNESMQNGTGMGEGSTAGAQNVSDEIEGEDQIEGVQNEEPDTTNEPDTNEDAVEMENDFQGAMGDADLETDDEDSDEESDDDEEPEMDEQMGDVDPTDPTSLDDKLWNDEEEKQEAKDEESKVDSKGQKQKDEEVDIVAGEEQGDEQDKDQDKDQNPDQGEPGDDEEMGSDEDEGSDDEGSDGDMDDRVNQDTLDRMADVEDQGEQLEMPDNLDMGDEEDEEEEGSDDGLEADMNELPEDQIEQKPDAMDEDRAEQAEDENMDDAVEGSDEQVDQGEDEGNDEAEDEAEDGSVDGDNAGDEGEDEAEGEEEGEEEGEDEDAKGLGEDAPEDDDRQNSGEKPTHGVDSAMNMDGTDDADPNTAAESRDAVSKPSDSSADNQQQSASQSSAQQDSFMPPQESQDQSEQTESERKLNPERTLADVIEKWERRLNMVMRDEEEEETAGENDEQADENDEAAPDSSEFEHTKPDADFDKVALADASEQERDQQEFQPMDIDEQDKDQEGGEHETAPETAPKPEDKDAENEKAQPLGANPQPKPAQREHVPDAAQMQQSTAGERPDEDTAMGYDDSDHEESNDQESDHEDSNDDDRQVDVEQLRHELEEATAAWRANAQDSERALELWQQYTRLTHDLSLMLTEQLRLILTPTQATQLRGDYRTGKRLNMKRIIPYIASDYRKDKIWLRRTKPARREYHVMVAVDNSKSMAQSPQTVELAYETLALITTALNQLEVGQLAVVAFGEHVRLLHPFDASFDADAGARVLSRFSFAEDKTDVVQLMDASLRLFEAASSQADLWRLQLVISDGMCQDHAQLLRQVRAAMEQRIMIVFIVLDRSAIAAPGAADIDPETDSIMNTKRVSFVPGADGKMEIKTERYIDTFPFKYYVVLRDIHGLPSVLAETLRQYFSLVGTE